MDIKSVIVEDESGARAALRGYLTKYCPQVQILGEAQDIREAVPLIRQTAPELVFLDVEMPYGNAFDVLESCKDLHFETIFVTAFSEYALLALNRSAAYYLLKPISIEELIVAVNKVQEQLRVKESFNRNQILIENLKEKKPGKHLLVLPTLEGFEVVKMENIVRLKGNGNFTDVHLTDGSKKMVCRFLKHFADLLPDSFMRVHKTHIINLNFVKKYHKGNGGYITLMDNTEIDLSANYKEAFLRHFG
jgi:two-component system LytT family response regulator